MSANGYRDRVEVLGMIAELANAIRLLAWHMEQVRGTGDELPALREQMESLGLRATNARLEESAAAGAASQPGISP